MRVSFVSRAGLLAAMAAAGLYSQASLADTLNLNYTASYDGSPAGVVDFATVNGTINTPDGTSINTYVRTFDAAFSATASTIPNSTSSSNPTGSEFYDDYIFTISGSTVSSITATIDLGQVFDISNLNVRLFNWEGDVEQTYYNTGTGDRVTIGATQSGSPIQFWTYVQPGSSGEVALIDDLELTAGTYVLQIRGNVNGTSGGGYQGALQITPVPLPAAAWLLASGLFGVGFFGRRRTR